MGLHLGDLQFNATTTLRRPPCRRNLASGWWRFLHNLRHRRAQAAAVAVERLRSFGDVNSDNRDCYALCHALADMQEDALHAKDYDFRQSMKAAN
jgi:hypothetical protein